MDKEKVVDKKEVDVQTEPVFIKSKDCESSTDDLNEFGVAVSGQTVKQEFKCRDCSENFRIKRHLMTHRRATHKEKVKICSKFATRNHCIFGSERCWYIHKESGTNNSLSKTEFECKVCGKVFRALPDLMWHNKQEHNENRAKCHKDVFMLLCDICAGRSLGQTSWDGGVLEYIMLLLYNVSPV